MEHPSHPWDEIRNLLVRGQYTLAQAMLDEHPHLLTTQDIRDGDTLLHAMTEHGVDKTVQWLLDRGVSLDARNAHGATPLHIAANLDDGPMIDFLVSKGSSLEDRDNQGLTPLLYACAMGCDMAVEYLLAQGADPSARCTQGYSMLGCFMTSKFYHDDDQAQALAERLAVFYSQPAQAQQAWEEVERISSQIDTTKRHLFLEAAIQAAFLAHSQSPSLLRSRSRF